MKKIKLIITALLRLVLLVVPGAAYLWWLWGSVTPIVAILAALGFETLWLFLFSFVLVAVSSWSKRKNSLT